MNSKKKYLLAFLANFIVLTGFLCLFDWNSLDSHRFISNVIQGFFFGIFMSLYDYWNDNRKKKEKDKEKRD